MIQDMTTKENQLLPCCKATQEAFSDRETIKDTFSLHNLAQNVEAISMNIFY